MENNKIKRISLGMTLALLLAAVVMALPNAAAAGQKTVELAGMSYEVSHPMADNLKALAGKKVSLILASGNTLSGIVKKVGPHFVHMTQLERKEYFDALIRTDSIVAIEAKFRKLQR